MKLPSFLSKKKKKYTLVISWWGSRGFYALGVAKWLEELWMKDSIEAIYGVSAGAILASYRSAGYSAEEIFDIFYNASPFGIMSINVISKKSLVTLDYFQKQFTKNLPKKITDLKKKIYIWTTDVKSGKFRLFSTGDLVPALLGSMAIPWIFPVVEYGKYTLMDGGLTNNFPVDIAKKKYPNNKIIGIALNKFQQNQKIKTILDTLSVSFEILLRNHTVENMSVVDHIFYKPLGLTVLDTSRKKMQKAYVDGYKDCMKHFR